MLQDAWEKSSPNYLEDRYDSRFFGGIRLMWDLMSGGFARAEEEQLNARRELEIRHVVKRALRLSGEATVKVGDVIHVEDYLRDAYKETLKEGVYYSQDGWLLDERDEPIKVSDIRAYLDSLSQDDYEELLGEPDDRQKTQYHCVVRNLIRVEYDADSLDDAIIKSISFSGDKTDNYGNEITVDDIKAYIETLTPDERLEFVPEFSEKKAVLQPV